MGTYQQTKRPFKTIALGIFVFWSIQTVSAYRTDNKAALSVYAKLSLRSTSNPYLDARIAAQSFHERQLVMQTVNFKILDSHFISENYEIGLNDGKRFFKPKGPFWGGFLLGLTAPITLGGTFLATLPIVLTKPKKLDNPENTNNSLLKNSEYQSGFLKGAKQRKAGKTYAGFGIGLGIGAAIVATWFFTYFVPNISS